MRFYLVNVHSNGYRCRSAFSADTLQDAARIHVDAYRATRTASALVLRDATGKRHSVFDSRAALAPRTPGESA